MAGLIYSMSILSATALVRRRRGIRRIPLRTCGKGRCDMRSDVVPRFRTCVARLCALATFAVSIIAPIHAQSQSPANNLPAGNGKDIVAVACTQCHGLKMIVALRD